MEDYLLTNAYLFSHGMGFFLFSKEISSKFGFFEFKIKKKNLNDVLSSLMVSTSKGKVTSISYSADVKETIKEKYLEDIIHNEYVVKNLRGQDILLEMINQEQSIKGKIIGQESYNSNFNRKKNIVENNLVLFDSEKNSILQVPFKLIQNLEVQDENISNQIQKALEVKSSQSDEEIILKFYYEGIEKENFQAVIGFTMPIPLWKINYRIKLSEVGNESLLESYCLISNPLNLDWIDTNISLITGRPVAFTYNLNRADKLERVSISPTVVAAVDPVSSEPDSYAIPTTRQEVKKAEATLGTEGFNQDIDGVKTSLVKQSDLNLLRYNLISNISKLLDKNFNEKEVDELIEKSMEKISTSDSNFLRMNLGQEYNFHLTGTKTIKARENAIIPLFRNVKLPCTKLLYLEYIGIPDSPYTSIELFNEVDYPFESGPCVIFEEGAPVGEAILPTCFTSQSRIISYSKEPRVKLREGRTEYIESTKTYTFYKKPVSLVERFTKYEKIAFNISSTLTPGEEKNPNLFVFDYKHKYDWEIVSDELEDIKVKTLEKGYRFTVKLESKNNFEIKLKFKSDYSNQVALKQISKSYYSIFKDSITDDEIKNKIEENFKLLEEKKELEKQLNELNTEKRSLEKYISRIRNNLNAIPETTSNKIRNNFVLKLNKFEEDIDKLEKQIQTITKERMHLNQKLEALK